MICTQDNIATYHATIPFRHVLPTCLPDLLVIQNSTSKNTHRIIRILININYKDTSSHKVQANPMKTEEKIIKQVRRPFRRARASLMQYSSPIS